MRLGCHANGRVGYSRGQLGKGVSRAGADHQKLKLYLRAQGLGILHGAHGYVPRYFAYSGVKVLRFEKSCIKASGIEAQNGQNVVTGGHQLLKLLK